MTSSSTPGLQGGGRRWPAALWLASGLGQLLVVGLTYGKLLRHPGQFLIIDHYDGIKSYFSLASFLRQPLREGLLQHGHNYPYGEYIFFTDIAPLVSVPLHWLVQAVPALAPYGLYLYDCFWLGGLVLGTLLVLGMLRRLAVPGWLAGVLSVALPWVSPQTLRLNVGHLSLAYVPAVLLPLWLLQGLYGAWRAGQPTGRWWLGLGGALVAASWLHFYYLGIVGGWVGFFCLAWLGREALAGRPWRAQARRAALMLGAAAVSTFGLLQVLDGRRGERPTGSGGYDWIEWKFQFTSLFRGYDYNKVRFVLEPGKGFPYESVSYLGGFVLFGLLLVAGLAGARHWLRPPAGPHPAWLPALPGAAADANQAFLGLLLLAAVPLALAALGESIDLADGSYVLHNYLNPFMWVHKLTDRITQFRALGRFIWPFWWAVVLAFAWYAGQAWRLATARRLRWLQGLWVGLAALAGFDMLNATHHYATVTQRPNPLAEAALRPVAELVGPLPPGRYQALLTLPFYHVGADAPPDSLSYTIDPDDPHCTRTYQLGLATGLPLLAHKATRTPYYQSCELLHLFRPQGPEAALLARFDRRPVLVYLDTTYYNGANPYYRDLLKDRPELLSLFNRAPDFIREQHLRRLTHQGPYTLYEWQPAK